MYSNNFDIKATQREEDRLKQEYPIVIRHIKVADDWCPNYPDGTVEGNVDISINYEYFQNKRKPEYPKYWAHIWFRGYDDDGMEKDFASNDLEKVLVKRDEYIEYLNKIPENIELHEYLYKDGFVPG